MKQLYIAQGGYYEQFWRILSYGSKVPDKRWDVGLPEQFYKGQQGSIDRWKNIIESGGLENMIKSMEENYDFTWFDGIEPNPTQVTVLDALDAIGKEKSPIWSLLSAAEAPWICRRDQRIL